MNYAAYFKKYGTFGATDLVLEVNSHDLWEDDPKESGGRNVGIDVSCPDKKPLSALAEGFERYAVPRIRSRLGKSRVNKKIDIVKSDEESRETAKKNLAACEYLYSLPIENKTLVIHRSRKEWQGGGIPEGEAKFASHAIEHGVKVIVLTLDVNTDYRDNIHLNESGQRKLVELLRGL